MQSLDEIYLGAREIADASARAAYLAEACGDDQDLRRRVEAMFGFVEIPLKILIERRRLVLRNAQ